MCMFCAAVPMSVSLTVALRAKSREKRQQPQPKRSTSQYRWLVLEKASPCLVVGSFVAAVVYHTLLAPRTGIW